MSFSLVESSSAKYLAVHLLIILSRLEEEEDPSAAAVAPMEKGEGAIRRGIRKWPPSAGRTAAAQCTRERVFLAGMDLVQTVFLLFNNGTFPQTAEKRVRPPRDKNRVVSQSAARPSNPWPSFLIFGSHFRPESEPLLPCADWKPEREKRYVRFRRRRKRRR